MKFTKKKKTKLDIRWVDIRFNACYELLHKYTISWGHKHSMHGVREILQRNPPPPTPPPPLFHFKALTRERNSFQFNEQNYLQRTARMTTMVIKKAIVLRNIYTAKFKTQIFENRANKPPFWKRYIDDTISLMYINRDVVNQFIEQA